MKKLTGTDPEQSPPKPRWIWFPAVAVGLVVVAVFHDRFGLAWDDPLQAIYGELCLDFYLSLGEDRSFKEFLNLAMYGSVFEEFSAAVHRILGLEDYYTLRGLLCGLVALATSFITVGLTTRMGARREMWFAGLFLFTTPQFWGQAFINSKDISFAAAYSCWWLCYIVWFQSGFKSNRWMGLSAVLLGVALGVRINAIPLAGFTVLAGMGGWLLKGHEAGESWKSIALTFPWISHVLVLAAGWMVMTVLWPTAMLNPVGNPLNAFSTFLDFPWRVFLHVAGTLYRADEAPLYTFMLEQFLSQPLWTYPLYGLGVAGLVRRWNSGNSRDRFVCLSMAFWILPIFITSLTGRFSPYNGVRQSLFLWPAYACLAAFGLWFLRSLLHPKWRHLAGIAASVCILLNGLILVSLHPLPYTYRNSVVHLFPDGINGFDADYHALSYRLAAEWMDQVTLARKVLGQPPPTVAVLADQYAFRSYSRFSKEAATTVYTYQTQYNGRWSQFEFMVILHPHQKKEDLIRLFGLKERRIVHRIENHGQLYALIFQSN